MSDSSLTQARAQLQSVVELVKAYEADTNDEEATKALEQDPLSCEVRCHAWASPYSTLEPDEYRIVLCMGGPHVEIRGDLEDMGAVNADMWHQDWFEELQIVEEYGEGEKEALLKYAQHFFTGE